MRQALLFPVSLAPRPGVAASVRVPGVRKEPIIQEPSFHLLATRQPNPDGESYSCAENQEKCGAVLTPGFCFNRRATEQISFRTICRAGKGK